MKKVIVEPFDFRAVADHLIDQSVYFISGSHSIFVPSTQTKYMNRTAAKMWPDAGGVFEWMTPGEAARTEMTRAWPGLKRVGWRRSAMELLDHRVPLYFQGPANGFFTYIDLTGAYHQIYRCLWLDVCYPRAIYGKFSLMDVADRLKPWKAARNSVVGITRSRSAVGVRGRSRKTLSIRNKFLSPPLWATVQEILHTVAAEAIARGAIYVNTDGYLMPFGDGKALASFTDWLTENGFLYHVRAQGGSEVRGWNSFAVGRFSTKPFKLELSTRTKEFSNVKRRDRDLWVNYWGTVKRIVRSGDVHREGHR